jgi:hypothetical protein
MTIQPCTWSPATPDACWMCTGEWCATHTALRQPCCCDAAQRHDDDNGIVPLQHESPYTGAEEGTDLAET